MNRRHLFGLIATAIFGPPVAAKLPVAAKAVVARPHSIVATYTFNPMSELKSIHGLGAEAELTTILSKEISAEMDRYILSEMQRRAKLPFWKRWYEDIAA